MKRPNVYKRTGRGIIAIELAFVLLFAAPLAILLLMFGQACLTYNVLQKGAHDAARYLATLPPQEMRNMASISVANDLARTMVIDAARNAHLSTVPVALQITVLCDGSNCSGSTLPNTVLVSVSVSPDDSYYRLVADFLVQGTMTLEARSTVRYGG